MENEPCLQQGKKPKPKRELGPDGAEAWCVAFAAFAINFIMAGLGRMSGILYIAFIDIFQTDRRQASLPFSVRSSMRNLLGPLVGILGQKYGVRPVIIVGGILGTLSSLSCVFADNILWMTILWGGFNGIGTALTTTLPQVTIGQHFKKYRTTASGISFSGGCIGSFVFPALLEYLLHKYYLGGTFFIITGILMNVIPAAMIMKTPTWLNKKTPLITVSPANVDDTGLVVIADESKIPRVEAENTDKYANNLRVSHENESGFSVIKYSLSENSKKKPLIGERPDTKFLFENRKLVIRLLTDDYTLQCPASEINQNKPLIDDVLIKEIEDLFLTFITDVQIDKISRDDSDPSAYDNVNSESEVKCGELKKTTHTAENLMAQQLPDLAMLSSNPLKGFSFFLENLFKSDRCVILQPLSEGEHKHISKILEELWKIHNILSTNKTNKNLRFCSTASLFLEDDSIIFNDDAANHPNTFGSHIKTACKLHMNPMFLLICLCRSVHFLTFIPMVTTIVDFSMDKGLPEEDGKYVLAALSFGDLMGRLCCGWITDKGYVTLPRFMLCVMAIQGVSSATLPFMDSRAFFMSALAVFGLLQGSCFVRHPVLVARYLGSHEQSIAMGCINFFSGILAFALPDYIGYFRDTIGSYNGIFYINGIIGVIVGCLWVFEPYLLGISTAKSRCDQPAQV